MSQFSLTFSSAINPWPGSVDLIQSSAGSLQIAGAELKINAPSTNNLLLSAAESEPGQGLEFVVGYNVNADDWGGTLEPFLLYVDEGNWAQLGLYAQSSTDRRIRLVTMIDYVPTNHAHFVTGMGSADHPEGTAFGWSVTWVGTTATFTMTKNGQPLGSPISVASLGPLHGGRPGVRLSRGTTTRYLALKSLTMSGLISTPRMTMESAECLQYGTATLGLRDWSENPLSGTIDGVPLTIIDANYQAAEPYAVVRFPANLPPTPPGSGVPIVLQGPTQQGVVYGVFRVTHPCPVGPGTYHPAAPVAGMSGGMAPRFPPGSYVRMPELFNEVGGTGRSFAPIFLPECVDWSDVDLTKNLADYVAMPSGWAGIFVGEMEVITPSGQLIAASLTVTNS